MCFAQCQILSTNIVSGQMGHSHRHKIVSLWSLYISFKSRLRVFSIEIARTMWRPKGQKPNRLTTPSRLTVYLVKAACISGAWPLLHGVVEKFIFRKFWIMSWGKGTLLWETLLLKSSTNEKKISQSCIIIPKHGSVARPWYCRCGTNNVRICNIG